jgi:hypothetical protein
VALGFLFSGYFTGHAEHTSVLFSMVWAPLVVWRLDVALLESRTWPALEAGALWGMSALAGYPAVVLMTAGLAALWALGRALLGWPDRTVAEGDSPPAVTWKTAALALVLFSGVGLIALAPTYAGFLFEGAGFTDRAGTLSRDAAIGENALHPLSLLTFASPHLSSGFHPDIWLYNDASSRSLYLGPLVVWFALLALIGGPRNRWCWWLVGIGALSLAVALGQTLPVRGWLYDLVPPSRFVRHAAMFRGLAVLSLAILGLYGSRELHRLVSGGGRLAPRGLWVSAATLSATALASYVWFLEFRFPEVGASAASIVHVVFAWFGIGAIAGLFAARRHTAAVSAVLVLAVCDAFFTIHLSEFTVSTTSPRHLGAWAYVDANRSPTLELPTLARETSLPSRSNHNLPLKRAVLDAYSDDRNRFHRRWVQEPVLADAALGERRIWFAARAEEVPPTGVVFQAFRERARATGHFPLVLHSRTALEEMGTRREPPLDETSRNAIETLPNAERIDVERITYRPEVLAFDVECPTDGWLLVTDRWAGGWRATVNGEDTPIWGGTFIFRAVPVERGRNRVRFEYHPFGHPVLLIASWSTLGFVVLGSIAGSVTRWRS